MRRYWQSIPPDERENLALMVPMALIALLTLLSALLCGCTGPAQSTRPAVLSSYGVSGRPIDTERVKAIRIKHTTKADLTAWFGPPINDTELGQGKSMLMWCYSHGGTATTLGFPAASVSHLTIQVLSIQMRGGTVAFYTYTPGGGTPISGGAIAR